MDKLIEDLKFGTRRLRASLTFTLITLLTLTLGIGATTAMFTLVNGVLLKPLPFPSSQELVYVSTINKKTNEPNNLMGIASFEQLQDVQSPLKEMAYFAFDQLTLARGDRQLPFTVQITSHNYLSMFGVKPILGRWYEARDINTQSIVISYDIWQNEFLGDPNILNREIWLDNQSFEVLGVMPQHYSSTGFTSVDLWLPINELSRPVRVVARLQDSLSPQQAEQQATALQRVIDQAPGNTASVWKIQFDSVLDSMVGSEKDALNLLLFSVIAVFFIAILNVINLTFSQYTNRMQEFAIRVSLGASRGRLLRQLITESTLLCMVGGLSGLLLSAWSLEWVRHLMQEQLPRLHEVRLDQTAVLFSFVLVGISALFTTMVPALYLTNPNKLSDAIKQAGGKMTGDKQSQKVRRVLVGGEVSLAVVLLICTGLLVRSYLNLAEQDTGFVADNIVTGHVWLPDNFEPKPNQAMYWMDSVETLKQLPGVSAVAATSTMPMSKTGIDYTVNYTYAGAPAVPAGEEPTAAIRSITQNYFSLLQVPVLAGREFDFQDTSTSPRVVVINEYMANQIWPNENVASIIGNKLIFPDYIGGEKIVVGVVGNVKHRGLNAKHMAEFFLPVTQHDYPGMSFLVKTAGAEGNLIKDQMLKTSIEQESTAPMILIESLPSLTKQSIASEKLLLTIIGVFAGVALFLASIGVYGISDNMVSQRTNEIGIRMAIGARPAMIRKWVVKDAAHPVIMGIGLGLALAFISGQFIASVLYGVQQIDPLTFALVPIVLLCVGLVATWLPAHRATKIQPQQALKYE